MINKKTLARVVGVVGTPLFVYSEETLERNLKRIDAAIAQNGLRGRVKKYVAYFTNSHPHLFKTIINKRNGVSIQSREELAQLDEFGLGNSEIIVSPTALSDQDLDYFIGRGNLVNVVLAEEMDLALGKTNKVGLRIDLTSEQNQRSGVKLNELEEVNDIIKRYGVTPYALHTYPGTGSDVTKLINHAKKVFSLYKNHFKGVKEINLGGGFAYDYGVGSSKNKHFPWGQYFSNIAQLLEEFNIPKEVKIAIEPGRDVLADVGIFVAKINRVYTPKGTKIQEVYTDGSYVLTPSATIRRRQHTTTFFDSEFNEMSDRDGYARLSGNTTLSSDFLFPGEIKSPGHIKKGGYVVLHDFGGYGATQHMEFLNKSPAPEILSHKDGSFVVITEKGNLTDKLRNVSVSPRRIC